MGTTKQNGSAALAGRLTAFGGVVTVLCTYGLAPVTAVILVLCATVVLAKV
jgi:hypothetical protein